MSVLVVGAGIIGCAIARGLAVRGVRCTVVDDRPIAGGATQASAGMLAPHVEAHAGGPLLDLGLRSLDLYDDWIRDVRRESGVDVEYRRIGTLEVALDAGQAAALKRQAPAGVAAEWFEPAAARARHPALGPNAGALLIRAHGYVAAPQLAGALATAAERHGATFQRATVHRIVMGESSARVTTSAGDHEVTTVVIAAGAWGNAIEGVRTPPLRPVRGQLLRLDWPDQPLPAIIWGPDCYVVPRLDGTILVGATVEDVGFDERTTEEGIARLLAAAIALLPAVKRSRLLEARVGLRPATPDELPVLGSDPSSPGVVHASGHYRNGILLAPITARLIADYVVDGKRDPSFESFRPDRF